MEGSRRSAKSASRSRPVSPGPLGVGGQQGGEGLLVGGAAKPPRQHLAERRQGGRQAGRQWAAASRSREGRPQLLATNWCATVKASSSA